MFLESNKKVLKHGWIEVICRSMFSGKTEERIRRLSCSGPPIVCKQLTGRSIPVIIMGSDLDYSGSPLAHMSDLRAVAECINRSVRAFVQGCFNKNFGKQNV